MIVKYMPKLQIWVAADRRDGMQFIGTGDRYLTAVQELRELMGESTVVCFGGFVGYADSAHAKT